MYLLVGNCPLLVCAPKEEGRTDLRGASSSGFPDKLVVETQALLMGPEQLRANMGDLGPLPGIAGGEDAGSNACSSAELYDPSNGTFTATTGNMTVVRAGHTATLLGNGKVLITGGTSGGSSEAAVSSVELYDPATDMFTATVGGMTAAHVSHTATLLQNGKVLIAGGDVIFFNGIQNTGIMSLNTAETFDPSTGMFTKTTGNMTVPRESHTATLLNSGKVLLGRKRRRIGQFTAATSMMTAERDFLTANLLASGKVLLAGGVNTTTTLGTADLFDPSSQSFTATGTLVTPRF